MELVINQLVLTVGAWNETGQTDRVLENQFKQYLSQLQKILNTNQEGAMQVLLERLGVQPYERHAAG